MSQDPQLPNSEDKVQNPYETPQNPYQQAPTPGGTGASYASPQSNYGYNIPPQSTAGRVFNGNEYDPNAQIPLTPLPLGVALKQLPKQYARILFHPSARTFDGELRKASWDIVWVQLLIYALVSSVLYGITYSIRTTFDTLFITHSVSSPASLFGMGAFFGIIEAIAFIFLIPLGFFASVGIYYLIAKAFKGQGTFLVQSYATLLYTVPTSLVVAIASLLFAFIPIAGTLLVSAISFPISIYTIVLNVFQIQSTHRLSGGKATAVVLIPVGIGILLAIVLVVILFVFLFALMSHLPHSTTY
ncbi:Yip1 family protein [Tengunoibacter tsumagoiensis]|uniref:Yip1 domain-containing protein n=1 Tax=Tengunoibacter tsumagoiensis TaxID=2014871 RepID=A0A401ZWY8_9CHLR|nr:Yip1 family protein [Tengunoibacter tsumagoiensis]GCE11332.1 hypothetical protein KTT_11910 [Tengunoibacter tsumagoiensis]